MISVWPGEMGKASRIASARSLVIAMRSAERVQNGQGLCVVSGMATQLGWTILPQLLPLREKLEVKNAERAGC
jgi:hypothetical protein